VGLFVGKVELRPRASGGAGTATTGVTGGATGIGAVASRIGDLEAAFPKDQLARLPTAPPWGGIRAERHAWRLGCDREGRVTAGAVRSGRGRFVSGRSQADAAGGPPLPNTTLFNTPSGAASAGKALAVALGPLGKPPGLHAGNGASDPESADVKTISTNCIHSISIGRTFRFRPFPDLRSNVSNRDFP
jgi:hypothetical protein